MNFFHCRTCSQLVRILDCPEDEDVLAFRRQHTGCEVERLTPTGRAVADRPWQEPLAERVVEVQGPRGVALLCGRRESIEQGIEWRMLEDPPVETLELELDAPAFWAAVDGALFPHHMPLTRLRRWAAYVAQVVRSSRPEDVLVLEDDPAEPAISRGALTPTASARIQSSLASFGLDRTTEERLSSAFDGARFPPLRIARRLVTASTGPGGGGEGRVSAGGVVPPAES